VSKELEKKIAKLKVAQSQLEVQVSNLEKRKNAGLREQNALLTKNTQLESTKLDLEEAKLQAAGKYDAMEKVRIQTAREKMVLDQAQLEVMSEFAADTDDLVDSVSNLLQVYDRHNFLNVKILAGFRQNVKAIGSLKGAYASLSVISQKLYKTSMVALIDTMFNFAMQINTAAGELRVMTGMSREASDAFFENQQQLSYFNVSAQDTAKTVGELYGTFTDFTFASRQQQETLKNTGVLLEKIGVSTKDFASGVQLSTKVFGQSSDQAAATAREFSDFAKVIGVAPEKMAADFSAVGDSLAKLGSSGPRAFKDLAAASKITGLEINKLIRIADNFDTFDTAAQQAGKLNAALGGNFVNAMDLMMETDPVERFKMIRDAIGNTGLTFDDMSYYQRKFFTQAAGLEDVSDLAKMMSGNFTDLAGAVNMTSSDYAELERKAKSVQDIQTEFKTLLMSLIPVFQPLIVELRKLIDNLTKNKETLKGVTDVIMSLATVLVEFVIPYFEELIYAMIAMKGVGLAIHIGSIGKSVVGAAGATATFTGKLMGLGSAAGNVAGAVGDVTGNVADLSGNMADTMKTLKGAQGGLTAVGGAAGNMAGPLGNAGDLVGNLGAQGSALQQGLGGAAPAMNSTSDAASKLGGSAKNSGKSLMGLGVAALFIGGGIAAAAFGLAELAKSFNGLGGAAGPAALAIVGFTAAFGLMMVGLMALVAGPQAALAAGAVGVLIAVGAAALAIGGGMFLATKGVANMTNALSTLVSGGMIGQIAKLGTALENLGTSMMSSNLDGQFAAIVGEMSRFENAITASGVANLQPFIAEMNDMANNAEQLKTTFTEARSTAVAADKANKSGQVMAAAMASAMGPVVAAIINSSNNNQQPAGKAPNINVHVELDGQKVSKNVETRIDKKLINMVGLK
jgi:hypothetical protein